MYDGAPPGAHTKRESARHQVVQPREIGSHRTLGAKPGQEASCVIGGGGGGGLFVIVTVRVRVGDLLLVFPVCIHPPLVQTDHAVELVRIKGQWSVGVEPFWFVPTRAHPLQIQYRAQDVGLSDAVFVHVGWEHGR
eukprot:6191917-Pleurochrysis_carterae.AAC.1